MPQPEHLAELADVRIDVELVPHTELVHLAIGDRAGLVLTRAEARAIARELDRASRRPGRPSARPRPRASAAAAS